VWQAQVLQKIPNSDFVIPQEQMQTAGQGVVDSTNKNLQGDNTQLAILQADMKFMMRSIAQSNHIQVAKRRRGGAGDERERGS
jgi:hypothetical protein